jgi:hypothetical protein
MIMFGELDVDGAFSRTTKERRCGCRWQIEIGCPEADWDLGGLVWCI